jgi:hypothetical protein
MNQKGGSGVTVARGDADISRKRKARETRQIRKITPTRSNTFSTTDRQDFFEK